ncbi:hypothetical protein [Massilia phosphatilytica]
MLAESGCDVVAGLLCCSTDSCGRCLPDVGQAAEVAVLLLYQLRE